MGLLISACGVIFLFMLRDVFILGLKQKHASRKLIVYTVWSAIYLFAAIRMASSFSESRAAGLLRSPWIWGVTLLTHACLWWAAARLKRTEAGDGMWWIAIVPAPMLILSIVAVSRHLSEIIDGWSALTSGFIVSAAWIAAVIAGVLLFRRSYREWEDRDCVGDVAEIASWTGIGILPFTGVVQWVQFLLSHD
jgi:hypothetical protein